MVKFCLYLTFVERVVRKGSVRLVRKWMFTAAIIEVRTGTNFKLKSELYYSFNKLKVAIFGKLQWYKGSKTILYVLL